ncbi:putative LRR receptor-like serine/threonine-protein kinase [Camellia lanceoleosa]|uniref:LRR receptor-like serine/threonine-protein kinase n=1 Tax=Camellia lanceoleosa TaxID=1840588 RepID=A0ACC0ISF8_9ERIC|nr:putative LRR receptor-like serine/threonine-protein kinase [Camellia lanceoleosa]
MEYKRRTMRRSSHRLTKRRVHGWQLQSRHQMRLRWDYLPNYPSESLCIGCCWLIPEELWTLTFLINLDLRQNYLTGSLSASIGNLSRMQYLAFGTNNFSGPLPLELGNLTKLEQPWASDNELTGSIPEFIGNWSKLKSLRFQGNSFGGPLPTTFSNLTLMEDLRISDLSNGSSSLAFLKDMKSLNLLILWNNNISGSIPSNITMDLIFNKLTGQIPDSLFNLSSLSYLFLGNNKLTGILPAQKSTPLLNIDLSYNELSGSFPFWISQQDLQLNLVANNFTIESSNNRIERHQRNFPCHRNVPVFKCGGPQITSSNQIIYERDNETLGPATYYVTSTNRWAVSNVGCFGEKNNAQYTSFSSSQFTNTLDSELFQTARISAGSLRYYGLGLQNGNYTGNLEWKDFDLRMEAGTCCVPTQGTYGPSISAISVKSDFIPTVSNNLPTSKKNKNGLTVGIVVPIGVVCLLSVLALYCFIQQRKRSHKSEDEELRGMDAKPYTFSYAELRAAVEDFHPANKLREGGFGPVYKVSHSSNQGQAVIKHLLLLHK